MKKFFYRVGKGEDVTSVAEKFSIPVTVVVSDNMLKGEISEGDILVLRGKIENINSLFGLKIYSSNEKPTNGELIALIADKMIMEG